MQMASSTMVAASRGGTRTTTTTTLWRLLVHLIVVNTCLLLFLVRVSSLSSQPYNDGNSRPWPVPSPRDARPKRQQRGPQQDPRLVTKSKRKGKDSGASAAAAATARPPAPLVDSTLLRFVSLQRESVLESQRIQPQQETNVITQQQIATTATTTTTTTSPSSSQWLGQYNSHLVAQALQSLNGGGGSGSPSNAVSETLAQRAGMAVQAYILTRMARRQLRLFLRQRDVLWKNRNDDDIDNRQQGTQMTSTATATPTVDDNDTPLQQEQSFSFGNNNEADLNQVLELMQEKGLTATDICTILTHTPSVALMRPTCRENELQVNNTVTEAAAATTLETTLTRAFQGVLLESLQLRKYDARKVLRNCPGLLTVRGSKNAQQIVTLLASCGVSKRSLARDKTALPVLLSRSPAAIFRLVAFLSSDAVRMNVQAIGPLLRRADSAALLNAVAPVPRLQLQDAVGSVDIDSNGGYDDTPPTATDQDETTIWFRRKIGQERRDQVNNIYRQMSVTAWTLRHELGTQDLGKVIAAYPSVLLLDAETQILPTASYLMNDLGIWQDDLPKVLQLYPALLAMDVQDMKRVVSYLLSLDVAEENLASIFRAFPSLFMLDIEQDMRPVVTFLRSVGIVNIGRFITRLPPVLGYSVEGELVPKWEFLRQITAQASFELSAFPAYFSYPLDRRIKARYHYLQRIKAIPTQLMSLDLVLRYGDRDFATRIAQDTDDGAAFLEFIKSQTSRVSEARRTRSPARKKKSKRRS